MATQLPMSPTICPKVLPLCRFDGRAHAQHRRLVEVPAQHLNTDGQPAAVVPAGTLMPQMPASDAATE